MEQLDLKEKNINICFKVDEKLDKEIKDMIKQKKWKKSAFIRVAIQKELNRLKEVENNEI